MGDRRDALRAYNREWMRKFRQRQRLAMRPQKMLSKGKCPICEMKLTADWHIKYEQTHIHQILFLIQGVVVSMGSLPTLEGYEAIHAKSETIADLL